MYKALRVLKVGGQIFYIGDVLPENAPEIINIDAFIAKGWIESVGDTTAATATVEAKPALNKTSTGKVDITEAMPATKSSKKKKKTKKKIGSILSSKAKETVAENTLEAATIHKPDLD
tara:strand:+ start:944 stop:1297 length:354 start_codon:yes stop_codon:yes gene_type:complete